MTMKFQNANYHIKVGLHDVMEAFLLLLYYFGKSATVHVMLASTLASRSPLYEMRVLRCTSPTEN